MEKQNVYRYVCWKIDLSSRSYHKHIPEVYFPEIREYYQLKLYHIIISKYLNYLGDHSWYNTKYFDEKINSFETIVVILMTNYI